MLGCLPFSIFIARLFKLPDPRSYGSGNTGATNVARSGNKTAAILTLFADAAKGIGAVVIALAFKAPIAIVTAAGVLAVLGHVFSIFLQFRGGRGVATAIGVIAVWDILSLLVFAIAWGLSFALTRMSSIASIVAITITVASFYFLGYPHFLVGSACIAVLIIYRHKTNIKRIIAGEELRFKK